MGRKAITTYGKHRHRMVATDNWSSEDEKKRDVFSFSNSFGNSDMSSPSASDFQPKLRDRPRRKVADKENEQKGKKGKKAKKEKFVLFSEKENSSTSSSSSDKFETKPLTRKALQDRNQSTNASGYCTRGKSAKTASRKEEEEKVCNTNFSEFEEYSLIVSSSPEAQVKKNGRHPPISAITSTPFRRETTTRDEAGVQDVSIIEAVEDSSPDVPPSRSPEFPSQPSLFSTPSPPQQDARVPLPRGEAAADSAFSQSEDSQDQRLVNLEESLRNLHVSRRFRKRQASPKVAEEGGRRRWRMCVDGSPVMCQVKLRRLHSPYVNQSSRVASESAASPQRGVMHNSRTLFSDSDMPSAHPTGQDPEHAESHVIEEVDSDDDSDNNRDDYVLVEESSEEEEEVEGEEEEEEEEVEEEEEEEVDEDEDGFHEQYNAGTFIGSLSDIEESEEEEDVGDDESTELYDHENQWAKDRSGNQTLYVIGSDVSLGQWEKDAMDLSLISEASPASSNPDASHLSSVCEEGQDETRYKLVEGVDWSPSSEGIEEGVEESSISSSSAEPHSSPTATPSRGSSILSTPRSSDTSSELGFKELLTPSRRPKSGVVESPRSKILHLCDQTDIVTFKDCIPPRMMQKCVKIGEGVYGEVFRSKSHGQSVALKIIPIEGNFPVNDEPQKTFAEILPEVVISKALSDLRYEEKSSCGSFCQVNSVACVKGAYPDALLKQWDKYNDSGKSENDRPDIFDENQHFIVFEFADGGSDLQSFQFEHPGQAKSVLQQVILGLAVAENTIEFEHRDLHIGNVLVQKTAEETIPFHMDGQPYSVASQGVRVCIIDFTLSRLRKDGCTVFCDLSKDETLFEGDGDLQFDVYRQMKEENNNQWEAFHPHSNVLWVHYLADKLLHRKRYHSNSRADRDVLKELRAFLAEARDFTSTQHMVFESDFLKS